MKRTLLIALVALSAPHRAALADESCLADYDPNELRLGIIRDEERAEAWASACAVILAKVEKEDLYGTGKPLEKCASDDAPVVLFCEDPLGAVAVPTYADVERVRRAVEAKTPVCMARAGGITTQSGNALFGSSFQDALIRGIAQFVVARAKAEAMAWFLDQLKQNVCDEADAKAVLPSSCALVNASTGATSWSTLKSAFETDLERLPDRAVACIAQKGGASDEVAAVLVSGVQAVRLLRDGHHPVNVLAGLSERFDAARCPADKVECGMHMLGFASRLLALSPNQTSVDNPLLFELVAARLLKNYALDKKVITSANDQAINHLRRRIIKLHAGLARLGEKIRETRKSLEDAVDKGLPPRAVTDFTLQVIELAQMALGMVPTEVLEKAEADEIQKALASAERFAQGVGAAVERDYSRALVYVFEGLRNAGARIPGWLQKYGPFVAEIATAKTADDIERAFEAAAAPVGAALGKRGEGRATVTLNAFLGLQGGYEIVDSKDIESVGGGQLGLFAPVGVDVSWGVGESLSIGLFVSVIDLGALASVRLEDSKTKDDEGEEVEIETTPEIGFEQVVSPGAFLLLGFDRFAVGVGTSLTPSLRRVTRDDVTIAEDAAWRFGAFLAIDVTILPF